MKIVVHKEFDTNKDNWHDFFDELQKILLEKTLRRTKNIAEMARVLRINRTTLFSIRKKLGFSLAFRWKKNRYGDKSSDKGE